MRHIAFAAGPPLGELTALRYNVYLDLRKTGEKGLERKGEKGSGEEERA